MKLYAHPFSSYCQKVLVALYENETPFELGMLDFGDAQKAAEFAALAPALLYADWAHPIGVSFANLRAYRQRLLARPSYARALDEARPYRKNFPLGDPGRD